MLEHLPEYTLYRPYIWSTLQTHLLEVVETWNNGRTPAELSLSPSKVSRLLLPARHAFLATKMLSFTVETKYIFSFVILERQ